jgi:valyl-tRNA synthetase
LSQVRVEDSTPKDVPGAHAVLRSGAELFLPLTGVVDVDRERERIDGEILRIAGLLEGCTQRLADPKFTDRAPPEVVERERDKLRSLEERHGLLVEKRESFGSG